MRRTDVDVDVLAQVIARVAQYDRQMLENGDNVAALAQRKRDLASLSRAVRCKSAPPEALQRWQRDRSNHKMLGSLLDEWRKDPSWGTVVVSERRRVEHLKRYERKVVWRMEQELRTMFTDQEYVDHLMNAKSKNPELVRNNPDAPGKHQWRQYAIFVDEVIDRTNHVNESEWQLADRPGPLRSTIFA